VTLLDDARVAAGAQLVEPPRVEITRAGVFYDMPDAVYHSDPVPSAWGGSISRTGAKNLLPPKTPAHFQWWRENGDAPRDDWDFGHVAHTELLGAGPPARVVEAKDWRTDAAKAAKAAARAAGEVPLLPRQYAAALEMVRKVREHPIAGPLLFPGTGTAEVSLFWQNTDTGAWCRWRGDWLPARALPNGRFVLVDYKTAEDASDEAFGRAAAAHGYEIQEAAGCDGVRALGLHDDPEMVFVVQEKHPPYLVNVVELPEEARELGRRKWRQAQTLFARCTAEGRWPGYADETVSVAEYPRWALARAGVL
jgi:hypothetical protein